MKRKLKITRNRDRQLKRLADKIIDRLYGAGYLTFETLMNGHIGTLVLDELRRAEARRKTWP